MDAAAAEATSAAGSRPTARLPFAQLVQISIYWFAINAIWGGWEIFQQKRVPQLVDPAQAGRALGVMELLAMIVAVLVQPTAGSLSDYTMTRWGRRKPYIAVGSLLVLICFVGIAAAQSFVVLVAFFMLLQFSSNLAQGPFQGYLPDLVPEEQVGQASGLYGLAVTFGLVGGYLIIASGYLLGENFTIPLVAIGLIVFATGLATVLLVREGPTVKPREGRSWTTIALETWGTDILRERSYVWLIASRFFILMAGGFFMNLNVLYLQRSLGLTGMEQGRWVFISLGASVLATALGTVPAARISDRVGRKPVIFAACAIGATGMAVIAAAPAPLVAVAGVALVGLAFGAFLAVDWALLTDIIPKASSGRYMGMSQVANATNGPFATAVGGLVMDLVGGPSLGGAGPRAAMAVAILIFAIGAFLLAPVREPRRLGTGGDARAARAEGAEPARTVGHRPRQHG